MKKKEFSKVIFSFVAIMFFVVIMFSMILMWSTKDTSAIGYLLTAVSGLMATTVGFYSWKAKAENVVKIAKENNLTLSEYDDVVDKVNDVLDDGISVEEGGM